MITTAEILEALSRAGGPTDAEAADAHTSAEIRAAMGWSPSTFSLEMKRLKAAGKLEVVKVRREALDGRLARVVGYRLLA
ncbi:MAG TPA: hypothetical protein VFM71_08735 [Gemmatimonadaceae bacterium]|nr:hypothetical protein [Gemmatimonadaceae bacterium]